MQNVIASEFILKANLPDRPIVGARPSQPESGGEERSDADANLARSALPQFAQLVESLQTTTTPSNTASITDFEGETAWSKQPGPAQSTLFATKNSDWLVHVAQPELSVDLAQEPIGTESQFEPDTKEIATPLSIPPVENMTKQQFSVTASPVENTTKAGIPSRASLPDNDIQQPAPALRKAQPANAVPADKVATEPDRQHVARPVVSKSGPAARGFPEIREMMSDTHPNTPEPSVRPQMTQGADASSTPPTSNVEVGNIAQSNRSEPDILMSNPLEHPPVSATTNPGLFPTDVTKIPLSRGSDPQQMQVRLYQSGQSNVAEAATVTRQSADVVAETTKSPETHLATKATEHHYGGVRSGVPPERESFQTTTAANPQAELTKNVSHSSSPLKPDPASALRAIGSGLTLAPVQLTETRPRTSPKTTVARMQSPDFQSNDIVTSDGRTTPPGDSQVLSSLALAETSGSVVSDKPDPLLLPGVSGSGSSVMAPANPTPTPFASTSDPMAFARISSQLASVAAQNPDAPIELTLSPEELGRVQMNFATQDGSLSVTISAERPETLALMRRHIDLLMQDFRELGFSDVNLGFDDQPAQQSMPEQVPAPPPPDQQTEDAAASGETPGVMIDLSTSTGGGIDVRL